jgi:hypothetical protein
VPEELPQKTRSPDDESVTDCSPFKSRRSQIGLPVAKSKQITHPLPGAFAASQEWHDSKQPKQRWPSFDTAKQSGLAMKWNGNSATFRLLTEFHTSTDSPVVTAATMRPAFARESILTRERVFV